MKGAELSNKYQNLLVLATLVLLGWAVYHQTLDVPFYLDDIQTIKLNPTIQDLSAAWRGLLSLRGLTIFTFALNFHFSGLDLGPMHWTNIAIHIGNAFLVFVLIRDIYREQPLPAIFCALIFLLHPIQTQAVTYLVQRMASLACLFFLLSVICYGRARRLFYAQAGFLAPRHLAYYALFLLCGGLAVLAKENTVVFPLVCLCYDRYLLAEEGFSWKRTAMYIGVPLIPVALVAAVKFGPMILAYLGGQGLAHGAKKFVGIEVFVSTPGQPGTFTAQYTANVPHVVLRYLCTQFVVFWKYLALLVLPVHQLLDYSYPLVDGFWDVRVVAGLLGLAGLFYLVLVVNRNLRIRFFALWILLGLLVESSLIPLDPLFEHRLYLPLPGLVMIAYELLAPRIGRRGMVGLTVAICLCLGILTVQRNAQWRDPVSFWEDNLRQVPYSYRVKFSLIDAYLNANQEPKALSLWAQVFAQEPNPALKRNDLYKVHLIEYAKTLFRNGFVGRAKEVLLMGLRLYPLHPQVNLYLGAIAKSEGDLARARSFLRTAFRVAPEDPLIRQEYFSLQAAAGN